MVGLVSPTSSDAFFRKTPSKWYLRVGEDIPIKLIYSRRGKKVVGVEINHPYYFVAEDLREKTGYWPAKPNRKVRVLSPTQFFDILGKVARGEVSVDPDLLL